MKTKIIVTSIALLGFTGSALAQGYMGAGVAGAHLSMPGVRTTSNGSQVAGAGGKTYDTGYKLYAGYNLTQNWGMELAYVDFGNSYTMDTSMAGTPGTINGVKGSSWNLAGIGTLPLSREFSVFGKVGWAWNHSDGGTSTNVAAGTILSVGSNSRSYAMFGVGANVALARNWAARLEYEDFGRISSDDAWGTGNSGAIKASAWSLSAKYSF